MWEEAANRYLPSIEEELKRLLGVPGRALAGYYGMMHYHLGWVDEKLEAVQRPGGKRLRPLLCLLACEASGGDLHLAVPAAAAIEIVHNFSLAHDDIQDGDAMRRHRPTLWKVWGVPQALNVGDGLFALGHAAMASLADRGVPTSRVLAARQILDRACLALIHGQYLDVSFEERAEVDEAEYLEMVAGKTAALFCCAMELGSLLAGGRREVVEHYRQFGHNLGLAFQMTDDILGIWGDPTVTGKPAASDILQRKKTLPVIYALRASPDLREIYTHDLEGERALPDVLEILDRVGARAYTERLADGYRAQALAELARTGSRNGFHGQLKKLAEFLTVRNY
jgi:geranylgeranyl diphosphate synthase type I